MKLGLKLWSTNTDSYLQEAKRLYVEGWIQYIELYVVPGTQATINKWKEVDIPFTLHAPHFMHGVNLAKKEYEESNREIFAEVADFYSELHAGYVVVHSGMDGAIEETGRQLSSIQKTLLQGCKILIENKPYKALPNKMRGEFCRGATIKEVQYLLNTVGCGFCLDIGHAICSANSQQIPPYEYVEQFNRLLPDSYHISDNIIDSTEDKHMHLGDGNIDFFRVFSKIDKSKNIAIETKKDSKENLNDFIKDVVWLKKILK